MTDLGSIDFFQLISKNLINEEVKKIRVISNLQLDLK